jgi:hypothetical protein
VNPQAQAVHDVCRSFGLKQANVFQTLAGRVRPALQQMKTFAARPAALAQNAATNVARPPVAASNAVTNVVGATTALGRPSGVETAKRIASGEDGFGQLQQKFTQQMKRTPSLQELQELSTIHQHAQGFNTGASTLARGSDGGVMRHFKDTIQAGQGPLSQAGSRELTGRAWGSTNPVGYGRDVPELARAQAIRQNVPVPFAPKGVDPRMQAVRASDHGAHALKRQFPTQYPRG